MEHSDEDILRGVNKTLSLLQGSRSSRLLKLRFRVLGEDITHETNRFLFWNLNPGKTSLKVHYLLAYTSPNIHAPYQSGEENTALYPVRTVRDPVQIQRDTFKIATNILSLYWAEYLELPIEKAVKFRKIVDEFKDLRLHYETSISFKDVDGDRMVQVTTRSQPGEPFTDLSSLHTPLDFVYYYKRIKQEHLKKTYART